MPAAAKKVKSGSVKKTKVVPVKKTKAVPQKKTQPASTTKAEAKMPIKKPNFSKVVDCRPAGVAETGLVFTGYEVSDDGILINHKLHYDQLYTLRNGSNSKHFLGFLDGKIFGTRCPKCGDKFFPPRITCWDLTCKMEQTEWVELKPVGYVHTFTIAGWSGRSSLKRLPFVLAYGIIDGCKTAVANFLLGLDPWDAEFGMPIKVVFKPKAERLGAMVDWHFEPGDGWTPGPMTPEKERMKKMTLPVYEWVKTMKE
ncbi:MAG: putative nucleic-acid-binding protein containing a Zn-ribbon [Promethearchaeota archaeon CR_4]|nr:MAG: putative nucleic-acid-binding protein containing a Zn-ribbon [Candidatus Lokiarchaeota archaeon CR_4]